MKITINARQMSVRESLKELVVEKLSKLDKYFYDEGEATVTFSKKRNNVNLEVTIYAANTLFRCETEDETFQNALDRSIDTIERQIRRNKTRLEKRLREGVFDTGYTADDYIDDEPEFKIRTKTFSFKPMSVEEAISRLDGIKCGFKNTSCPDQVAKALELYKEKKNNGESFEAVSAAEL